MLGTSGLLWRVLGAVTFVVVSESAAAWFRAVPVGTVTMTDVVPGFLVGAAHNLAGHHPALAANTAGVCVGAASWYRALLRL